MAKQKKLKKWTQVYPQGTRAGDEEQRFFIALARHPKYKWRSTSAISKEANLTKERVEEIIQKYYKAGLVVQNPQNEDQWGYWERLDQPDEDEDGKTVVQKDHEKRIKKVLNPSASGSGSSGSTKGSCGSGQSCCGGSSCSPKKSKATPSVQFFDKMDRLEELKLEVMARNPMILGVSVGDNYIKDANDVGRALSYVTGDPKWEDCLKPFDFNSHEIHEAGIQLPSVSGSWIVCDLAQEDERAWSPDL